MIEDHKVNLNTLELIGCEIITLNRMAKYYFLSRFFVSLLFSIGAVVLIMPFMKLEWMLAVGFSVLFMSEKFFYVGFKKLVLLRLCLLKSMLEMYTPANQKAWDQLHENIMPDTLPDFGSLQIWYCEEKNTVTKVF